MQMHHMVVPMLHWVLSVRGPRAEFNCAFDSVSENNIARSPEVTLDIYNVHGITNMEASSPKRQPAGTVLCGDYVIAQAVQLLFPVAPVACFDGTQIRHWLLTCLTHVFFPCPKR